MTAHCEQGSLVFYRAQLPTVDIFFYIVKENNSSVCVFFFFFTSLFSFTKCKSATYISVRFGVVCKPFPSPIVGPFSPSVPSMCHPLDQKVHSSLMDWKGVKRWFLFLPSFYGSSSHKGPVPLIQISLSL